MKCLSIKPKFCEEILDGSKTEEFRSWPTHHRGVLLLHASSPVKAIVGYVLVTDCLDAGVYEDGYAWQLAKPVAFAEPVPVSGKLGLWNLPADLEAAVKRQMDATLAG